MDLRLYQLTEGDFDCIIELGARVHGENYLSHEALSKILKKSLKDGLCCSYVLYDLPREKGKLVGFRLTYAPGMWELDEWCSVEDWGIEPNKVCYFKSNTIDPDYGGRGLGPYLLDVSIQAVERMGAVAGVTHIWLNSPNNSAFRYFSKTGAQEIKLWPGRWSGDLEKDGYECIVCCSEKVQECSCNASEMILYFGEQNNNE